jgi:hypothetical protein
MAHHAVEPTPEEKVVMMLWAAAVQVPYQMM